MPESLAFDGAAITDAEYQMTQERLMFLAQMVDELPLDAFLQRLEEADVLGPLLDPSLYMRVGYRLWAVRDIARAAREFQAAFRKARERLGKGQEAVADA